MKPQTMMSAILFAAMSALSVGASAAEPEKKPMKPHSHMEEKMGMMPRPAETAAPAKEKADEAKADKKTTDKSKDKSRHLHPRDGKS